jgi:methylphosphotriester-DNA--protein-cysteine methyltransferase
MLVEHVRGGTNSINVPPTAFAMPAGMAMRYDMPDPALSDYLTGYAIYASSIRAPMLNWYLPAPAMISVLVDAGPLTVSIGNHRFGPLGRASFYGPTSRAFRTETHGGIAVGIGLSALGWSRLTTRSAGEFHNRVVSLGSALGTDLSARLIEGLDALDGDALIKPLLDEVFGSLFNRPHPRDDLIRAFTALSVTDGVIEMKDVADRLDIPTHELRRMATRHFGMPPKLLLRRARFLRSFISLIRTDGMADYSKIDSSYFDASHFLRDAGTFLGTTPRRFIASDTVFLRASLRARAMVIGAPTQALHEAAKAAAIVLNRPTGEWDRPRPTA